MEFSISGLPLEPFEGLIGRADEVLAGACVRRYIADTKPGFPCRVTLEDAAIGESVLLLNYEHHAADTPFRASHAIYVRENAARTAILRNDVPASLRGRMLSVRSFDTAGMMLDADLAAGSDLEALIERLFSNADAQCLHVHYAKRGCYAARIDRG